MGETGPRLMGRTTLLREDGALWVLLPYHFLAVVD